MFDAKSILESMMRGAGQQQQGAAQNAGGFGDILGQLAQAVQTSGASGASGGLGDVLRKMMPPGGMPAGSGAMPPAADGTHAGGLGDILGRLQQAASGAGGAASGGLGDILAKLQQAGGGAGSGGLMDVLNQVLGQATQGVREGAGRVGEATGATDALGRAMGGQSGADILAKLKEFAAQNQFGAGAAAGGLGAVVLGTQAGRTIAASAAKLGALALIGGLAYKAFQNYQTGKPLITGVHTLAEVAPAGSGFEPAAVTHESALLYIKAMIAAAAADGRVDKTEMIRIMGAETQAGMGDGAEEFLANEINAPASVNDLAEACETPEQSVQVYTAARLAVTPDGGAEDAFLASLAEKLGVDAKLAAHIDAAARTAA